MTDKSVEQANSAAEAKDAETANETDDLDAILSEFETDSSEEQTANTTQPAETEIKPSALEDQVKQLLQREAEKETRSALDTATGWAKEVFTEKECEVPEEIDDMFVGYMDLLAQKDRRIAKAFMNRDKNPAAWKKLVVAHAEKYAKALPKASQDSQREAIAGAVALSRGETKETDGAKKWLEMSDREFKREYNRMAGLTQ